MAIFVPALIAERTEAPRSEPLSVRRGLHSFPQEVSHQIRVPFNERLWYKEKGQMAGVHWPIATRRRLTLSMVPSDCASVNRASVLIVIGVVSNHIGSCSTSLPRGKQLERNAASRRENRIRLKSTCGLVVFRASSAKGNFLAWSAFVP